MWRQREVELGPGATGYCITRSRWPRPAGCIPARHLGQRGPSPAPGARGPKAGRDVLNFRFLSPENILYPRGGG